MGVDELLRLASSPGSLGGSERVALAAELRRRRSGIVPLRIAEAILEVSISSARKIEEGLASTDKNAPSLSDGVFQEVVTEFAYLLIHLCYRDSFAVLADPGKRIALIHSVFNYVLLFGKDSPMSEAHRLPAFTHRETQLQPGIRVVRDGMDEMSDREREYAPLPLFAGKGAPLVGTVFWEFGRHIASTCGNRSLQVQANLIGCEAYTSVLPAFSAMREPRKQFSFFRRLFERMRA